MTKVSANEMNWDKGDIFVVPPRQFHCYENTTGEDAILLLITDRLSTEVLGLYREEAEESLQGSRGAPSSLYSLSVLCSDGAQSPRLSSPASR
jgi:oxalate decarboxylase/phosphoglucose isomerase-like protein (cupin superfamily)